MLLIDHLEIPLHGEEVILEQQEFLLFVPQVDSLLNYYFEVLNCLFVGRPPVEPVTAKFEVYLFVLSRLR